MQCETRVKSPTCGYVLRFRIGISFIDKVAPYAAMPVVWRVQHVDVFRQPFDLRCHRGPPLLELRRTGRSGARLRPRRCSRKNTKQTHKQIREICVGKK